MFFFNKLGSNKFAAQRGCLPVVKQYLVRGGSSPMPPKSTSVASATMKRPATHDGPSVDELINT
eukprot:5945160-Karenia_brevis.AAC.1